MSRRPLLWIVLAVLVSGCSSDPVAAPELTRSPSPSPSVTSTTPQHVRAEVLPWRLPGPLAREALAPAGRLVLVAGGLLPGDASTATAYLLDLVSGRARPRPDLAVAVHDTAGALASGPLVIGGGNSSEQSVVQALGPQGWSIVAHLPAARSDLSAVSSGARVVVVGGYDGLSPALAPILASVDGTRWRRIGSLPIPVRYAATAVRDGVLWVFGGESDHRMRDAVQRVDLATGAVTVVGRLPRPLGHASAAVLGGRILVAGGRTSSDVLTDRMWWFDPDTHAFSRAGRLPTPLADSAVTAYDGAVFLVGGETPEFSDRVIRLSLR